MLRRTLLASAGAIALTGPALAADLPSPPPVFLPPPPVMTWTGLYLGINAGGTWSSSNSVNSTAIPGPCDPGAGAGCTAAPNFSATSATLATFSSQANTAGFIGGGQIGYNYQFNNSYVAGIEVDIQGVAGANGTPT
jgi:outer membrane immunogenic protein